MCSTLGGKWREKHLQLETQTAAIDSLERRAAQHKSQLSAEKQRTCQALAQLEITTLQLRERTEQIEQLQTKLQEQDEILRSRAITIEQLKDEKLNWTFKWRDAETAHTNEKQESLVLIRQIQSLQEVNKSLANELQDICYKWNVDQVKIRKYDDTFAKANRHNEILRHALKSKEQQCVLLVKDKKILQQEIDALTARIPAARRSLYTPLQGSNMNAESSKAEVEGDNDVCSEDGDSVNGNSVSFFPTTPPPPLFSHASLRQWASDNSGVCSPGTPRTPAKEKQSTSKAGSDANDSSTKKATNGNDDATATPSRLNLSKVEKFSLINRLELRAEAYQEQVEELKALVLKLQKENQELVTRFRGAQSARSTLEKKVNKLEKRLVPSAP